MSKTKIKKCPFCGAEPLRWFDDCFQKWVISCENEKCHIQPSTKLYKHKGQELKAWNKRSQAAAAKPPRNERYKI